MRTYAVVTRDPRLVYRLAKRYNSRIKGIIIVLETDDPRPLNAWAQKHDLTILRIDMMLLA